MQDKLDKIRFIHGLFKKEIDELMKFVNTSNVDLTETQGPPMDVVISDTHVRLFIELPGAAVEDFTVYQYDDLVVIEGVRPRKTEESVRYLRVEREPLRFRRAVRFPFCVNDGDTTAKLKEGVLEIVISRCACDLK